MPGIGTLQISIANRKKRHSTSPPSPPWTAAITILTSGAIQYKREINTAGGYFVLSYSSDSGATWEVLMVLDLTEDSPIIDLTHLYRHRIVGTAYHVDNTLTPTGYPGIEGTDWENIYST